MKIELAKHAGFCFGVKKAVDQALALKEKANTLGPLIHNPQVVEELEKKGIKKINKLEEADASSIIIRTHGASDKLINEIKSKNYKLIDLTCPFVKKVQQYAKDLEKDGYTVIIIGEKNHPEVEAIADNLKKSIIIEKPEDVDNLPKYEKIGVVVQTTQPVENFTNIIKRLENKATNFKIHNTICHATSERQQAAIELAKQSDIMVVVGGKNSANTTRLAELCDAVVQTHHIETVDELKKEWFIDKKKAGVSAGASTPQKIMNQVIERIKNEF